MGLYYRGMESPEYWRERARDRDAAARKSEDQIIREINNIYSQAFREVKMEFDSWFNTYAIDNNMTLAEARRRLTPMEMRTYKTHMERMKKIYNASHSPFVKAEIDRLGARAYVTRQMALIDSIDKILIETSHNVQIRMEDYLIGMYQREYEDTMNQFRISGTVIPKRAIKEIIEYPYAGNMFSSRIWRNKQRLLNYIERDLAKGLVKGSSIQRMSKDLMSRCDVLYYQAARLVRTETNYVMNQGHLNGYKDAGIKEYEFLAFIDNRTSPQCKELDGQIINANDATVGTNMPPMHPNCRSTIIPIVPSYYWNNMEEEKIFNADSTEDVLTFKDKKEAADHAIKNLGFKEVNWGRKITHEMAGNIVSRLDSIFNAFPKLKGTMKVIQADSQMGRAIASVSYGGNLNISTKLFWDVKEAEKMYDKCLWNNFHPKGTNYLDVITHESSHMIERIFDWNKFAPKVVDKAFNNMGVKTRQDRANIAHKLSKYATKNDAELMAEAFADAMSNKDKAQEISKEIFKILKREMK